WECASYKIDGLCGKWVHEFDLALASAEPSYRGNCGINPRRSKWQPNLRRPLATHSYERRACAITSQAGNDKLAAHVEFVGRNQLVILCLPEAIRNCTVGKQILASIRCREW